VCALTFLRNAVSPYTGDLDLPKEPCLSAASTAVNGTAATEPSEMPVVRFEGVDRKEEEEVEVLHSDRGNKFQELSTELAAGSRIHARYIYRSHFRLLIALLCWIAQDVVPDHPVSMEKISTITFTFAVLEVVILYALRIIH
jgi:hypothetical protein